MAIYDIGDGRRLTATFRDMAETPADPTTIGFTMTEPDGTTSTYAYGADAELVREAAGVFHVDWTITQAGRHHYKWTGAGDVIAAEEASFLVRESKVL